MPLLSTSADHGWAVRSFQRFCTRNWPDQRTLFSGQTAIVGNDNWGGRAAFTAAFTQTGAFVLPAASRDAALLATLQPGSYSVQASGVAGTTGVAIVEIYEVP